MYRFANMGRVWVPVLLPAQTAPEEQGAEPVKIHILLDLFTDAELDARDRDAVLRSGAALLDVRDVTDAAEVDGVLEKMHAVKSGDRADILQRAHDWHGLVDEADVPVPFSRERLEALLGLQFALKATRAALFEASREGVRKN